MVIVGGGIMGTSTAYHLACRSDLEVVLLEKDAIGSGSTGDSSAILRHHYGDQEVYSKLAWWSHTFYREFEERTGEPIARAENPLVRFGIRDTPTGDYVLAGYDVLERLDIPVTRFGGPELEATFPMLELDGADFGVRDDTAAYSDGSDAAGGFARAAQAEGATVLTGVEVTDILVEDGTITGVETDAGAIDADAVVLTVGPWTETLAASVGLEVPITRSREQVLILEPPAAYLEAHDERIPTSAPPGGDWYVREDFNDGVLVATHHTGERVFDPDHYRDSVDESVLLDLTEKLGAFVPGLEMARLRGDYCGVYSETPDRDFILDRAGPDGLVLGCGFSGHGFKHGPAVGRILSDLVIDGDSDFLDVDLEYFSLSRFEDDPSGHGRADDAV